jgi:hypothetical protein
MAGSIEPDFTTSILMPKKLNLAEIAKNANIITIA